MKLEEMVVNLRDRDQFIKATPRSSSKSRGRTAQRRPEFEHFTSRIEGAITLVFRSTPVDKLSSGKEYGRWSAK